MEPLEVLTSDERRLVQNARRGVTSHENDRLIEIIDRLAARIAEFERGQVTPRERVLRNVSVKQSKGEGMEFIGRGFVDG